MTEVGDPKPERGKEKSRNVAGFIMNTVVYSKKKLGRNLLSSIAGINKNNLSRRMTL